MGGKDKDKKKDKKNKDKKKDGKKKNKSSLTTGQKVAIGGAAAIALAGVAAVGATVIGVGGYKVYQSQQGEAQDKSALKLRIRVISGHNLQAADSGGVSDPYVVVTQGLVSVKTDPKPKTVNPIWNHDLEMGVYEQDVLAKELKVSVFDKDMLTDDSLGTATIALNSIPHDSPREFEVKLIGGQKGQNHGSIKLALHFVRAGSPGGPHGGPPPQGYPPQQGGYPPQQGGYPPQHGGYPPQQGGYPPQQGGWAPPGGNAQRDFVPAAQGAYGSQGGYGAPPDAYGSQGGYGAPPGAYGSQGGYGAPPTAYGSQGGYGAPPQGGQGPQDPSAGGSGSLYTF